MVNHLTYGGKSTREFNTWISGEAIYGTPERDVSFISVPGRSGDLVIDNKRFNNINVKYPAFIKRDFDRNFEALSNYLLSLTGYQRITDTYHPDEFRLGMFTGTINPSMMPNNREGTFDLNFNCKPYRYLKSGEIEEEYTASANIYNPTAYSALPVIRIYGTGTVGVGGETIIVTSCNEYVEIDCETGDAYKGTKNCNSDVTVTDYPDLDPGLNGISLGTGITKVVIKPRWRKI